jgi:tRNA dimethylallyltransferase
MSELKPLIVILGPTASGKTGLALDLAKKFDGELVNADSRQVYRGMDIATNKVGREPVVKKETDGELLHFINAVPIHLLDLVDPDQEFSLFDFKQAALRAISKIQESGRLPILVGGTGLYISAIADNLDLPPASKDPQLREKLAKKSATELFSELQECDPAAAGKIGAMNKRKLIRALEVCRITGQPFSGQQRHGPPLFRVLEIGINTPREELYRRIDARVDEMLKLGLVAETKKLVEKYGSVLPALSGIGYREIGACLRSELTLADAVQQIKFHTHQYARRQMTWFKRASSISWVNDPKEAENLIQDFLK